MNLLPPSNDPSIHADLCGNHFHKSRFQVNSQFHRQKTIAGVGALFGIPFLQSPPLAKLHLKPCGRLAAHCGVHCWWTALLLGRMKNDAIYLMSHKNLTFLRLAIHGLNPSVHESPAKENLAYFCAKCSSQPAWLLGRGWVPYPTWLVIFLPQMEDDYPKIIFTI